MTNKEALAWIQCIMYEQPYKMQQALIQAEKALEKQMPKKVERNGFYYWECPSCKKEHASDYNTSKPQCCPYCGQRLDWQEESK